MNSDPQTQGFEGNWGLVADTNPQWYDVLHVDNWCDAQHVQRQGTTAENELLVMSRQDAGRRIWPIAVSAMKQHNTGSSNAVKSAIAGFPWSGSGFDLSRGMSSAYRGPTGKRVSLIAAAHRHPKFVSWQRARDGWAWYTSNIGRLLPNYRDIDVEGEEERLPYLGNSDFHAWQQIPETDAPLPDEEDEAETPFLPSQLRFEQSDSQLPGAPTGSTGGASRRIQGKIRLPPLPPPSDPFLAPDAEQQIDEPHGEDMAPSMETQGTNFPSQGGGSFLPHNRRYLSLIIFAIYLKILIVSQSRKIRVG